MSTQDKRNPTINPSTKEDVAMSADKTPTTPPLNTQDITPTGDAMQTSDRANTPHHKYYAYGFKEEE